uniref:Uncharacterized protein n=1 Tax=Proboscia inermis TaxID=420281 RepID=A0A7S0GH16_9STRA|mmetsp:Transcript_36018/g.36266  ORF Transcript_36018/g.36266 Transcript_36018/m.36266 type:complete len:164 (+) Transcript_36018:901-1392(+)
MSRIRLCVGLGFGNILALQATYKNWEKTNVLDKIRFSLSLPIISSAIFFFVNEMSLMFGAVALSILCAVMLRSLFGKAFWVKLRPMYSFAALFGLWMATIHVVLMGYKGWDQLFKYETKEGQPFITWVSTMFPIAVLTVNILLSIFGTKKRVGSQTILKHSVC